MYDDDERGRNGRVTRVYGYHDQVSRKERGIKRGGALAMERAATGASPYSGRTWTTAVVGDGQRRRGRRGANGAATASRTGGDAGAAAGADGARVAPARCRAVRGQPDGRRPSMRSFSAARAARAAADARRTRRRRGQRERARRRRSRRPNARRLGGGSVSRWPRPVRQPRRQRPARRHRQRRGADDGALAGGFVRRRRRGRPRLRQGSRRRVARLGAGPRADARARHVART